MFATLGWVAAAGMVPAAYAQAPGGAGGGMANGMPGGMQMTMPGGMGNGMDMGAGMPGMGGPAPVDKSKALQAVGGSCRLDVQKLCPTLTTLSLPSTQLLCLKDLRNALTPPCRAAVNQAMK